MEKLDNGQEFNENRNKLPRRLIISFVLLVVSIIYFKYENAKFLKDFINEEKKKNNVLTQLVDEMIKENNQMKIEIKNLQKEKYESMENQIILKDMNSKIIKTKEEIKLLSDQLTQKGFIKNKKVLFKLIYRASTDGSDSNNFYRKCSGKINTIILVQTIKGCKFGGYTETQINNRNYNYYNNYNNNFNYNSRNSNSRSSSNSDLRDPNSFVFSLNKLKIYNNKNENKEVISYNNGIEFIGAFTIYSNNLFNNNNHYIYQNSNTNFFSINDEEYEINNGDSYFAIRELEVFEVLID